MKRRQCIKWFNNLPPQSLDPGLHNRDPRHPHPRIGMVTYLPLVKAIRIHSRTSRAQFPRGQEVGGCPVGQNQGDANNGGFRPIHQKVQEARRGGPRTP